MARGGLILALAGLLAGCLDQPHQFENQGTICLFPDSVETDGLRPPSAEPQLYPAERPLRIRVSVLPCLSNCEADAYAECSARVEGDVIDVRSSAGYTETRSLTPRTCNRACRLVSASCLTPPLPAGSFTVRHGAARLPITLPSTIVPPCTRS